MHATKFSKLYEGDIRSVEIISLARYAWVINECDLGHTRAA